LYKPGEKSPNTELIAWDGEVTLNRKFGVGEKRGGGNRPSLAGRKNRQATETAETKDHTQGAGAFIEKVSPGGQVVQEKKKKSAQGPPKA